MEKFWLKSYPDSIPAEINPRAYSSIIDVFQQSCDKYRSRKGYHCLGSDMTYDELDKKSERFASFLQHILKLKKGDRLAIMLPNLLQYPVVMFGALKAGLTVVNINPLYTVRELTHQLNDTGSTAIVVLENFASIVESALPDTPLQHIITTQIGDLLSFPRSLVTNLVVKYIKRMITPWNLPESIKLTTALKLGAKRPMDPVKITLEDIAFLQGTSGTTGVPKSAALTHGNMVANMEQMSAWAGPSLTEQEIVITALPLYHIFSLTVNCLTFMKFGSLNVLITNPRDIPGFVKELSKLKFTSLTGVNTLFNALCNNAEFNKLDFSSLNFVISGGMALQRVVAERWQKVTGNTICEGYGLTEASPVISANLLSTKEYNGSIGLPLPSTEVEIRDDSDKPLPVGEIGELCARGPQVMSCYWQREAETKEVIDDNGWLRTGDIARIDEKGYIYIVDRKKNMVVVSGFNVYPTEVEDVIASIPGVAEVAVVGVPCPESGEAVKAFIVKKDPNLTQEAIVAYCRGQLTRYKIPKLFEFRTELPKNNVGKILHRVLRDETKPAQ